MTYLSGPTTNDIPLLESFPYQAHPHNGFDYVKQLTASNPADMAVNVEGLGFSVPTAFMLAQNYPNPFNPSTNIQYTVNQPANVSITVYDLQGRVIRTLVNREHSVGTHQLQWDAGQLASGTYFYRLEADGQTIQTRKALLIK